MIYVGVSWLMLVYLWLSGGHLGSFLAPSWPSWLHLGALLGPVRGQLGASWLISGVAGRILGAPLFKDGSQVGSRPSQTPSSIDFGGLFERIWVPGLNVFGSEIALQKAAVETTAQK